MIKFFIIPVILTMMITLTVFLVFKNNQSNQIEVQSGKGGSRANASPSPKAAQANNPITFNPREFRIPEKINFRGLNLIFFADQYSSWEEFENDVSALLEEAKKVEPWRSYSLFNIYKINPQNSAGMCYIKTQNERKPTLRCREEINDYLNVLPLERFKLIVLSRSDFQSWANVTRIGNSGIFFSVPNVLSANTDKKSYGILFLHLLGHSFGLKDEELAVLAKYNTAVLTPDGPNCAPNLETAREWWGDLALRHPQRIGFFQGCGGDIRHIKPTQSSLMNLNDQSDFIADYGPVSELYLNKILEYCFTADYYVKKDDAVFFEHYPEIEECYN
ncbi:MAG: hypothetical protein AAB564_02405 [Patescibacteria group bacterium]